MNRQRLFKTFNEYTAYGRPHYKAARPGAFELVRAKIAYDYKFKDAVVDALLARFNDYCDEDSHDAKSSAKRADDNLRQSLKTLGLSERDALIVFKAVRAAAFDCYCVDHNETRRFAQ